MISQDPVNSQLKTVFIDCHLHFVKNYLLFDLFDWLHNYLWEKMYKIKENIVLKKSKEI